MGFCRVRGVEAFRLLVIVQNQIDKKRECDMDKRLYMYTGFNKGYVL